MCGPLPLLGNGSENLTKATNTQAKITFLDTFSVWSVAHQGDTLFSQLHVCLFKSPASSADYRVEGQGDYGITNFKWCWRKWSWHIWGRSTGVCTLRKKETTKQTPDRINKISAEIRTWGVSLKSKSKVTTRKRTYSTAESPTDDCCIQSFHGVHTTERYVKWNE